MLRLRLLVQAANLFSFLSGVSCTFGPCLLGFHKQRCGYLSHFLNSTIGPSLSAKKQSFNWNSSGRTFQPCFFPSSALLTLTSSMPAARRMSNYQSTRPRQMHSSIYANDLPTQPREPREKGQNASFALATCSGSCNGGGLSRCV